MRETDPLRVVRIVTRLNVGGPTRQIASLMSRLDPARFAQILVAGPAPEVEGPDLIPVTGERVEIPDLGRKVSPGADRRALRAVVALLERIRPDIVHTHQAKAGWIGRIAAARAGVPVVVHTYHGHTFRGYFPWPQSALFLSLERMAAKRSTALIAQAEEQAADLAAFLGAAAREKTRIIRPGIELPPEPAPRVPHDGVVRVVFPSRLEAVKDPLLALEVVRRLPARFELHAFGDGALRPAVERALSQDGALARRVVLRKPRSDPAEVFGEAGVTLLTSREEGTPLALIESQAFRVPVVAANVGAVRSVVAPGGGVVVPREAGALAQAVAAASASPVGDGAVQWIRERFDAGRMVAEVAALYEELAGTLGSSGAAGVSRR